MYDLIGDIHGHADQLEQLLLKLDYEKHRGIFRHPERKVLFLGDFIDRGPQIREVLEIVRPMVEGEHALAVMGNHEFNALAYHTLDLDIPGEYLRRRTINNHAQHRHTMEQLSQSDLASYLGWFRTLPLWLDLDGLRAVHACWDLTSMDAITQALAVDRILTDAVLHRACRAGTELFDHFETVLKGKEIELPEGIFFHDKDGHVRRRTRVKWYLPHQGHSYRSYSLTDQILCEDLIAESLLTNSSPYPTDSKPVFVGHYWMFADRPSLLAHNVACLDYSVAKNGFLCAYRWNGEQNLSDDNFVWFRQ